MDYWYIYFVLAIVVSVIPVVGKYFYILNTLVHESGHAFIALIFGDVKSISLFANTEGEVTTSTSFWIGRFFTTYAGYTTSSAAAIICFYFIDIERGEWVLYGLVGLAVFNLIFWVRNLYGFIWLCTFIALSIAVIVYANVDWQLRYTLFLSSIIFVQSIMTAFTIFKLSIQEPDQAGDAKTLSKLTFVIPTVFWGGVFFAQSIITGYLIFYWFIL